MFLPERLHDGYGRHLRVGVEVVNSGDSAATMGQLKSATQQTPTSHPRPHYGLALTKSYFRRVHTWCVDDARVTGVMQLRATQMERVRTATAIVHEPHQQSKLSWGFQKRAILELLHAAAEQQHAHYLKSRSPLMLSQVDPVAQVLGSQLGPFRTRKFLILDFAWTQQPSAFPFPGSARHTHMWTTQSAGAGPRGDILLSRMSSTCAPVCDACLHDFRPASGCQA